jgi:hypothetical protein
VKEIAGLSAADYDLKWSERPNEIKMLQPRPGIINESAQVVFTREGRVRSTSIMKGSNPILGRTWATSAARPVSKMQPFVYTTSLRKRQRCVLLHSASKTLTSLLVLNLTCTSFRCRTRARTRGTWKSVSSFHRLTRVCCLRPGASLQQ